MNNTTAYTPLESLLFFQSLFAWGTESITFSRISEALKNHELINQAPTYDPGRLSSDALRELYKQCAREEGESEVREDGGSPSPAKKRKLQSPTSNDDRYEHTEKLARLVEKSYAWYTKSIVRDIREDERRYAILEREIQEIESRENERATRNEQADRHSSTPVEGGSVQRPSSGEFTQPESIVEGTNAPASVQTKEIRRQLSEPSPPARSPSTKSDGFAISDLVNGPAPSRANSRDTPNHSRNGSFSSQSAYPYPTGGPRPPPLQTAPQGLVGSQNYNWPHQASPSPLQYQHHGPGYSPQYPPPFSPNQQQNTPRGSFSGPSGISSHQPIPSSPLTTSGRNSVIQLPPIIPQPTRSSASPARSLDTLADLAGQQNHIPSYPHPQPAVQAHGTYGSQQFSNPTYEGRPQSGNGHSVSSFTPQLTPINTQSHLPPPGYSPQQSPASYVLTPRPVVDNSLVGQQANAQYNSPYNGPQNGLPQGSSIPNHLLRIASMSTPSRASLSSLPQTPAFGTPPNRPANSTGRGTRWKSLDTLPQELTPRFKGPQSLESPIPEPLSPVLPKAKLPIATSVKPSVEGRKTAATQAKKNDKSRGNERTKRGRARADSNASSAVPDSMRSESEMSHGDELSMDNGPSSRRVKEEVATPQAPIDEGIEEVGAEKPNLPQARQTGKRKRVDSPEPPPVRKPAPATHVIWTRNFTKICASALDAVSGHRNASTFSAPVKDRDAPQYSSLIKHPQDLKSIRTAIVAGTRAAAAIANAIGTDPSQTKVKLPISDDIMPPHGIVNNQQLEKELAHMFANAVMYNPSPKGFAPWFKGKVADKNEEQAGGGDNYEVEEFAVFNETMIMSRDVDKIFGELRAAERPDEFGDGVLMRGGSVARGGSVTRGASVPIEEKEEVEEDETVGDADGIGLGLGSVAKRRRRV